MKSKPQFDPEYMKLEIRRVELAMTTRQQSAPSTSRSLKSSLTGQYRISVTKKKASDNE